MIQDIPLTMSAPPLLHWPALGVSRVPYQVFTDQALYDLEQATMQNGAMSVFAVGLFNDLIVKHEGVLRFKEKTVICDSSRIDTLLVIPI